MPFDFRRLDITDVIEVEARVLDDPRGFFMEMYSRTAFLVGGITQTFVQDNHSRSHQGVLRGLHYQKEPHAQGKLVIVLSGEIFDVAVDLRRGSPTFGSWVGRFLSGSNHRMLYIPEGFAHGFCAMSDGVDVVYKVTSEYAPQSEAGIAWNDPDLAIEWPIGNPMVGARDASLPSLHETPVEFVYPVDDVRVVTEDKRSTPLE